jgi:hypothetical protein
MSTNKTSISLYSLLYEDVFSSRGDVLSGGGIESMPPLGVPRAPAPLAKPSGRQSNTVNTGEIIKTLQTRVAKSSAQLNRTNYNPTAQLADFQKAYDSIEDLESEFGALGQLKFQGGMKLDKDTAKQTKTLVATAEKMPPKSWSSSSSTSSLSPSKTQEMLPKTEPMDIGSAPTELQPIFKRPPPPPAAALAHRTKTQELSQQAIDFAHRKSTPTSMLGRYLGEEDRRIKRLKRTQR